MPIIPVLLANSGFSQKVQTQKICCEFQAQLSPKWQNQWLHFSIRGLSPRFCFDEILFDSTVS